MPNYKQRKLNRIVMGGLETEIETTSTVKILSDVIALNGSADTLLDTTTGLVYSVPAGKTLKIVAIQILIGTAAASSIGIYEGDTENANTVLKQTLSNPATATYFYFAGQIEIAATKFVTYLPASVRHQELTVIGYET